MTSVVVYFSVFVGSFSRVMTAVDPGSRRNERIPTALSRYPPPLLRKSRMIALAHEFVRFLSEVANSRSVCSPKNATSMYLIVPPVRIFSYVDGIMIVSRITSVFLLSYFSP